MLEAGAGIGNLSRHAPSREHLLLVNNEPLYVSMLQRFRLQRPSASNRPTSADPTVVSVAGGADRHHPVRQRSSVSRTTNRSCGASTKSLRPAATCIAVVPAGHWLYTSLDEHCRAPAPLLSGELRRTEPTPASRWSTARPSAARGAIAWTLEGHLLRRRRLSPREFVWSDRLWPLIRDLDHACRRRGFPC